MESDVVGLLADLGARPLRGTVFTSRRAAVINGTGLLESAAGNPDDCLRVDGSSGPCGDPGTIPGFVDHETPSGLVDGSNRAFSVASVPDPSPSLAVYRNGVLLKSGLDYIVADNWITFTPEATPQAGDVLLASYRVGSSAAALTEGPATPRVLCAGVGTSSAVTAYSTIANCAIAPGALQPGDRVELRFDCSHEGTATGFALEVMWGDTTVFQRNAAANDALVSGRADAALHSTGAQMSTQSWGTALGFAASVASAQDSYSNGLNLQFFGKMNAQTGETVTLRNYTVLRYRQ